MEIGERVKELRKEKKFTIKQMSELTGLSTGFISQFERGITTIDVDHLNTMAQILDTDITDFFGGQATTKNDDDLSFIVRGYRRPYLQDLNRAIHFSLSNITDQATMKPEYIEIMPNEVKEKPTVYAHEGEELVFVLQGILTLYWNDQVYKLFPGDSAHYPSTNDHNWANMSEGVVKMLVIHAPAQK
jgi:transcriptional regulator with XRE-family HTH domain